jgi:hypothetical protein
LVAPQDQHAAGAEEPVELDEELVEGVVELPVAAHVGVARPADGVELVDEDDRRGFPLGRLEELAHAGGAEPDELLHEAGGRHVVEGHAGLTGQGPCQQGLATARRPIEEDAPRKLGPEALEAVGVGEVLGDLPHLGDGVVEPGHVGEGDRLVGGADVVGGAHLEGRLVAGPAGGGRDLLGGHATGTEALQAPSGIRHSKSHDSRAQDQSEGRYDLRAAHDAAGDHDGPLGVTCWGQRMLDAGRGR